MLIEIQCSNLGEYDPSLGRSSVCGQRLMVDSNQIGQLVMCPKCNQTVEVTASKYDQPNPKPRQAASQATSQSTAKKVRVTRREKPPQSAPTGSKPRQKKARAKVDAPVKTDVMDVEFDNNSQVSSLAGTAPLCKKCGVPAPYGRCPSCNYVEPRYAKMHLPLDKISMQMSGMQLWFCRTLRDGMSIQTLATISHGVAIAFFVAIMVLIGLLFMTGSSISAWITTALLALFAYFYLVAVYKGYQFLKNPKTKLSWFQRMFWNFILMLARIGKWESYDSKLKNRRVIKVSEKGFIDSEIPRLEGIRNVQVLDLENTEVTDQGVALLYRLEHLQCLVLRRTNVTHDAVVRLQQTFPKLWIWY